MRVPERLSPTTVFARQHRTRASGRGRTDDASGDDGPSCPGSLIVVSNRQPYRHEFDDESVVVQTRQCLDNVAAILESEGLSLDDVLKVTVFLDDVDDFEEMNETYAEYFEGSAPARSAVEVGAVPKGAALEVEAVATVE